MIRYVVSITGGKLTTYRIMAAEVVDVVATRLGKRPVRRPPTYRAVLPGGDLAYIDEAVHAAQRVTADDELAMHLVHSFGSRWPAAADEIASPGGAERIDGSTYTIGEMRYAARHELSYTLSDILLRRTHLGFETRDHGVGSARKVATAIADILGWSDVDIAAQIAAYERDVQRIFTIENTDR